ncbi:MAG: ABC transporter substrate-binding protein [Deltaproteobacteria bacterium]|nr:ABC transporter substrate-binding protein [Deltaproteobacteria bacterium]
MKKLHGTAAVTLVLTLALALSLAWAPAYAAESPKTVLQSYVDRFLTILKDPKYQGGADKKEQDDKIWTQIDQIFDFDGVARLAVGRNWKKLTPEQQKEFSDVFAKLLGTIYLKKIRSGYRDQKVVLDSEELFGENKALVRTRIIGDKTDLPVDYNMWNRGGSWRIYDVKVEGVSLVKNYRSQFDQIMLNQDGTRLINRVKEKLAEEEKTAPM